MKLWIALIFGAAICASQPYPIGAPALIGAAQYGQYNGGYVPKAGVGTTPIVSQAPVGVAIGQTAIPAYGFGGYNAFGGLGGYGGLGKGGFGYGGFGAAPFLGGWGGYGGKGGFGGYGGFGGPGKKGPPPPPPAPLGGGPGHKGGGPGVFVNAPIYVSPPVYAQPTIPIQPKVQQQQPQIYYQQQQPQIPQQVPQQPQQPIIQYQQPVVQQQPIIQQQPVYQQPVEQKQPEVQQPQPQQPIEQPPAPQPQAPRLPCPVLTNPTHSVEPLQNMPDNSVTHQIVFEPNHAALNLPSPDWVDLHYSINQDTPLPWQMNYRMQKMSDNEFVHPGILLRPGDKINYAFTYCIMGGTDCDTGISGFSMPAPQQPVQQKHYEQPEPEQPVEEEPQWPQVPCPAIDYQQGVQIENAAMNSYKIIFRGITDRPVDWVDLHVSINPTPNDRVWQTNIRMTPSANADKMFEFGGGHIILHPGDSITYSFTYCSAHVDCNTPLFTFGVPQPVQQKVYQQPQPQPQPVIVQQPQPVITQQKQPQPVSAPPATCPVIQFNANVEAMGTAVNGGAIPHKITFTAMTTRGMDWVDLHYTVGLLSTGWAMNHRMRPLSQLSGGSTKVFESPSPINLMPGDVLRYAFTYCSEGTDCDTSVMTFSVPQTVITTKSQQSTPSLPAPALQNPIINTATGVVNLPSIANCAPVQFTHRALNYIDQEGSPKIRLFFLANANSHLDKVTVRYLVCNANSCPSSVATVPDASWQVTRPMYAKENLAQGFELTNVPALQPGMKLWYGFVYERTGENMRCATEAYIREYQP